MPSKDAPGHAGQPDRDAHVDVWVLDGVTGDLVVWLQSVQPLLVVAPKLMDSLPGITVIDARLSPIELVFDGAQWEVRPYDEVHDREQ